MEILYGHPHEMFRSPLSSNLVNVGRSISSMLKHMAHSLVKNPRKRKKTINCRTCINLHSSK